MCLNEFALDLPGETSGGSQLLYLATIANYNSSTGATLTFDGQTSATTKRYKHVANGTTLSAGDRVLVAKISGTYVILGKISF